MKNSWLEKDITLKGLLAGNWSGEKLPEELRGEPLRLDHAGKYYFLRYLKLGSGRPNVAGVAEAVLF